MLPADATLRWCVLGGRTSSMTATSSAPSGESVARTFAHENDLVLVVPTARITFIDTMLPPVSRAKRDQLVRFAIEDKLTIDPATVHAVILGAADTGVNRFVVAAIDRTWLARALEWLKHAGVIATRAVAETALDAVSPGEWLLRLHAAPEGTPQQCHITRADGLAYLMDSQDLREPPFALTLALNEVAASQSSSATPTTLRVVGNAVSLQDIDRERWQAALGKETTLAITPEAHHALAMPVDMVRANLLVDQFAIKSTQRTFANAAKPAWILAFAMASLHMVFISTDAWRLQNERDRLETEARQIFTNAFPNATTIVDPALQLTRNLAQMKSERGIGTDPVRQALALAASATQEHSSQISAVSVDAGSLTLTLSNLNDAQRTQLQTLVARDARMAVQVSANADNTTLTVKREGTQ